MLVQENCASEKDLQAESFLVAPFPCPLPKKFAVQFFLGALFSLLMMSLTLMMFVLRTSCNYKRCVEGAAPYRNAEILCFDDKIVGDDWNEKNMLFFGALLCTL